MRGILFADDQRFYAMLSKMAIERVDDLHYNVPILNVIQQEELKEAKPRIMRYLSEQLHNSLFQIEFVLRAEETTKEAFTAEERLKMLAAQNPHLLNLRNSLGLVLE